MKPLKTLILLAAVVAGQSALAQTTDPFVNVTVESLPATVTVSVSSTQQTPVTYVGYLVTVTNNHSTSLNVLNFNASTGVTSQLNPALVAEAALNGLPSGCTPPNGTGTTVTCNFGAGLVLAPNGGSTAFPVIVKVPTFVDQPADNQAITLSYNAQFKNGNTNSSNNSSFGTVTGSTVTPVGPLNTLNVKSLVIKNGGSFFTGANGLSTATDQFTTRANVPTLPSLLYTTAQINESSITDNCNNFRTCYQAVISIGVSTPVTFSTDSPLQVVLRMDSTNIKPGTKIANVVISYTSDAGVTSIVGACATGPVPRSDGVPCIAQATAYTKFNTTDPNLIGDFEWILLNIRNGSWSIR